LETSGQGRADSKRPACLVDLADRIFTEHW
jgi:hypothetical protein